MASEKETLDDKKPEEVIEEQQPKDNDKEKEEESMQVDKKDVESEEEKEESEEEDEEKEEEKPVKKKGKSRGESTEEPVTPITRPTRERKTVERYSESSEARGSTPKPLSIRKVSFSTLQFFIFSLRSTYLQSLLSF